MTGEKCPKCGRPLEKRYSARPAATFVGCTGWKDKENPCTFKRGADGKEIAGPQVTDIRARRAASSWCSKEGRFGVFFTCEGAPGLPDDDEPRRRRQAGRHRAADEAQVPEVREAEAAPEGRARRARSTSSARTRSASSSPTATTQGNPVKPPDTGINCEKCGSPMVVKVALARAVPVVHAATRSAATRSRSTPSCGRS